MARRFNDEGMKPWPKELSEFDPAKWHDRQAWHAARLKVARSLGRPRLPEARGMVRVKRHNNNGRVL